jgi:hypothetical protein
MLMVLLALYLIIRGYKNKSYDYNELYSKSQARIYDRVIESKDNVNNEYEKNVYVHKKKFRIKILYEYEVNNQLYTSYFYNDGKGDGYLDQNKFSNISKKYNNIKYITVYYKNDNHKKSCISFDAVSNFYVYAYYVFAIIIFIAIPFVMFIQY